MASEQWPGHALLCQGWPLESLLVNGFKFWLPTCYCWLPTPIDWLLDREISVVLQQIWCFIIQCWVVVPLFKLVSYWLCRWSTICYILWACHTWQPCVNLVLSQQMLPPSGCLALWHTVRNQSRSCHKCLISEISWQLVGHAKLYQLRDDIKACLGIKLMLITLSLIRSKFSSTWIWQPDICSLNLWLINGQTMQKTSSIHIHK